MFTKLLLHIRDFVGQALAPEGGGEHERDGPVVENGPALWPGVVPPEHMEAHQAHLLQVHEC